MKLVNTIIALYVLFGLCSVALGQAEDRVTIQSRIDAARSATEEILTTLGGRLISEMAAGGPEAALLVCRNVAPSIVTDLSLKNGWQVTRVSSRPRNAMIGMPDAWEQAVLRDFEARLKDGEGYETMTHYEVVDEPLGKSLRYMTAIETKAVCLACHGSVEQISEAVQTRLESEYPYDRATGYQLGDLRGAVSIKQPIP